MIDKEHGAEKDAGGSRLMALSYTVDIAAEVKREAGHVGASHG